MAPLRCCSFNCRGWRSGISTLRDHIDSHNLCFVQEHWLHNDHLNKINDISSDLDFLSVSISGMNSGFLLCGRPYIWGMCYSVSQKFVFLHNTIISVLL